MTNTTKTVSKKDQIKTAIMGFLNKPDTKVTRADIDAKFTDQASTRTIGRALAELKLGGLVLQIKEGRKISWTSVKPVDPAKPAKPAKPIKKDTPEKPIKKDTKKQDKTTTLDKIKRILQQNL